MKLRLLFMTALCCVFSASLATGARAADITITDYRIIGDLPAFPGVPANGPSTLQAGANPDAGSTSGFSYANATEDLEQALTNFAPGLLGDPTSVPRCPEVNLQADTCPADTRIGTSRLETYLAGTNAAPPPPFNGLTSLPGVIYNAEPLANEPGRLGIVTTIGATKLVSSIPFYLTPRGSKDYGLTGILSDINRLQPPTLPVNLQVARLTFILNGSTTKYVRNPTSCGDNNNTGQAHGWNDKTIVEGPAYSFTTSGCESVPFGPSMSFQVGDRGTTRQFGFPPLDVKVSVPSNDGGLQADIRNNVFTLPIELNSNNPVYKLCTQAQANADACPANSKFGNATAKSPFLHEPVGGPIYLIEQPGNTLPGLLLDMYGRVHVKLQVSSKFVNGNQIQSITSDAPQVPITELTLGLNGGRTTGVFQARKDLCFKQGSTSQFRDVMGEYSFVGWNGKATGTKKVRGTVEGCGPAVSPSLSGATGSKPSLKVSVKAHPDSPAMKEVTLKMEDGLSLSCKRVRSGVGGTASANNPLKPSDFRCVNSRTLKVKLPTPGARNVTVRLRNEVLNVRSGVKKSLRRGTNRHLTVKGSPTPVSGTGTSTATKFTVKGRK